MILKGATSKDGEKFVRIGVNRFQCVKALAPAAIARPAIKSTAAYSAALVTRLTEDWPIIHSSADAANRWSLRQLRGRSRDLERNGGIANAYLSALEANIIGSKGIGVQMKIKEAAGRIVSDPAERKFLKALQAEAQNLATHQRRQADFAALMARDPVWAQACRNAARTIKAQPLYAERDGEMAVPAGELDRFACFAVESEFKAFSKRGNCDVTGKHSLMDLCRLALRTSARDGDALLLVHRGYRNRWGVAFQLVEGDYLDDYYNVERLPNGNRIRMGVELDAYGKKVAFWVFAHHPGDYGVEGVNSYDPRRRRIAAYGCPPDPYFTDGRFEAIQAIHVSKSKRAEETRAVPWVTPAMQLIHHIETYKEAEITAARAEACKHVMYERDAFAADGTPLEWDNVNGQLTDEMQPGGASELPPGVHANYLDPKHPNQNMPDFLKAMKREVAMALDACYNTLFGDLESVNYSSIRAGTLNERESFKMNQQWFGDDVFTPLFESFLGMSLLSGALPFRITEYDRLNCAELKFRRWPWVDPKNDAETAKLLLDLKVTTRSRIIADMSSEDFEETLDELDYEAGYIAEKENLHEAEERQAKLDNPAPPQAEPAKEPEEPEDATKALPAPAVKSAFLCDVPLSELPPEVSETVAKFHPCTPESRVSRYGMTVPELLDKADQHNLETARHHLRNAGVAQSAEEVRARADKFILVLNDRIIDGHHHLAKAEKGKVTSSLPVLDLTPLRFQVAPAV